MRHGSLFSGIGGFDLAAEWMGWENVFHCEINKFCQKVLKYHFPNSILYEDITKTDFSEWRGRIDIVTGGFPCKQTSVAAELSGNRNGLSGKDSGLAYFLFRAADEIRSDWIIIENVPGVKEWENIIQKSMEDIGYTISRLEISASDCGLPHKRKRYIYVCNANSKRLQVTWKKRPQEVEWYERLASTGGDWLTGTPGIIGMFNGVPNRVDRIKALGNAIVPQIAFEIFKAIEQVEGQCT